MSEGLSLSEGERALYRQALTESSLGVEEGATWVRLLPSLLPEIANSRLLPILRNAMMSIAPHRRRHVWLDAVLQRSAPALLKNTLFRRLAAASPTAATQAVQYVISELEKAGDGGIQRLLFDRLVQEKHAGFVRAVNESAQSAPTVVFITSRTDYKPLREAIALKKRGYACFLIHLEPFPDLVRPLFEKHILKMVELPLSPRYLAALVAQLRPKVLHVHCAMWHYVLSGVVMENAGDSKVVCEYNDITSFYAKPELLRQHFRPLDVDLDLIMERQALHHAAFTVHQFDDTMVPYWREKFGGDRPILQIQPYPMEEWIAPEVEPLSVRDGRVRMVWAGQIPGRISCPPTVFDAYYLGEAVEKLLAQGFGVVAYQNPMFSCDFDDPNFLFYRDLSRQYSYFEIRPGVCVDKLSMELSRFDFGLILFDIDFTNTVSLLEKNKTLMVNKLSTYMEAGIPFVVNAEYEAVRRFTEENGFGIAVRSEEITELAERVRSFDWRAARKRIRAYTGDHTMEKEIIRLIKAYETAP